MGRGAFFKEKMATTTPSSRSMAARVWGCRLLMSAMTPAWRGEMRFSERSCWSLERSSWTSYADLNPPMES